MTAPILKPCASCGKRPILLDWIYEDDGKVVEFQCAHSCDGIGTLERWRKGDDIWLRAEIDLESAGPDEVLEQSPIDENGAPSRQKDSIPNYLRIALWHAQRSFERNDIGALAAINKDIQPLIDAAVNWGQRSSTRALRAIDRLRAVDSPWPTADVLRKLAEAADILLDTLSWDKGGWEQFHTARIAAREILPAFAASRTGICAEFAPETPELELVLSGHREDLIPTAPNLRKGTLLVRHAAGQPLLIFTSGVDGWIDPANARPLPPTWISWWIVR